MQDYEYYSAFLLDDEEKGSFETMVSLPVFQAVQRHKPEDIGTRISNLKHRFENDYLL
jgi:hypothetical protein